MYPKPPLYIKQSRLPSKGELRNILTACLVTVALMVGIYWLAFHSGMLHSRADMLTTGQAEVKAGLERIERQNAVTAAIASQEAERAASHYRRVRELADTMQVNPFKGSK